MPVPIRDTAAGLDLSSRFFSTTTVAASPTDNTETTIATITVAGDIAAIFGVYLFAFAAFTIGTNGTAINMRIRKGTIAGTVVVASGAIQGTAANHAERQILGVDLTPTLPSQLYVVTLTVTGGSAASTVSAVTGLAVVV
jgi:hypothetical protein